MANLGYRYYAGLKGSKYHTVGLDPDIFNFTDLQTAIDAADNGDTILIEPRTWTLTTSLSIAKPIALMGMGGPNETVITSALATRTIMLNVPAYAYGSAIACEFANLKIGNTSTGDGIEVDNDGGAAQNLTLMFRDCSITSDSGVAFDLDQTTTTKDIFVYISGSPALHSLGASTFDQTKAASAIFIRGMYCTGAFTLSNTNVASTFSMISCLYKSTAQTVTGHAAKYENYIGCMLGTSGLLGAISKGAATDFDAAGTEAAVIYN